MGRILSERMFQITPHINASCRSENTSYGFRHLCTIFKNGRDVGHAKATYYNRTWEAYEFQSVLKDAINSADLTPKEKAFAKKWVDGDRTDWSSFQMTGMIAGLGDIMTNNKKESNVWKKKMIQAGMSNKGLSFPDDWDTLSEDVKKVRLDKVVNLMNEKRTKTKPMTKSMKKNKVVKSLLKKSKAEKDFQKMMGM